MHRRTPLAILLASLVVIGLTVAIFIRTRSSQSADWRTLFDDGGNHEDPAAQVASISALVRQAALERLIAEPIPGINRASQIESLSTVAGQTVAIASVADFGALLSMTQPFGGRVRQDITAQLREHWRRAPSRVQPEGWRSWTDRQIADHLQSAALPWQAIDLKSLRFTLAGRRHDNQIDPRTSRIPIQFGQVHVGRVLEVPDVMRSLASGSAAALFEFDFRDFDGVLRRGAIWFCEVSPDVWCIAGSTIDDEGGAGRYIL